MFDCVIHPCGVFIHWNEMILLSGPGGLLSSFLTTWPSGFLTWLMIGNQRGLEKPELLFPGVSTFSVLMRNLFPYTCFLLACCGWSEASQGRLLNQPLAAPENLGTFTKLAGDSPSLWSFNISFSSSVVKPRFQEYFLMSYWWEILDSVTLPRQYHENSRVKHTGWHIWSLGGSWDVWGNVATEVSAVWADKPHVCGAAAAAAAANGPCDRTLIQLELGKGEG